MKTDYYILIKKVLITPSWTSKIEKKNTESFSIITFITEVCDHEIAHHAFLTYGNWMRIR